MSTRARRGPGQHYVEQLERVLALKGEENPRLLEGDMDEAGRARGAGQLGLGHWRGRWGGGSGSRLGLAHARMRMLWTRLTSTSPGCSRAV